MKILKYQTVDRNHTGNIHVLEGSKKIKFKIKRVYFINEIKKKHTRSGHAHKNLQQIITCITGAVLIKIFDGNKYYEFILKHPKIALYLKKGLWREITFLKINTILHVICSEKYKREDYIRSKNKFIKWKKLNT